MNGRCPATSGPVYLVAGRLILLVSPLLVRN